MSPSCSDGLFSFGFRVQCSPDMDDDKEVLVAGFDLKTTLKRIDPELRREFFSAWPPLAELDWSQLGKKRQVDHLFDALQKLSSDEKREVNLLLRTFERLKETCGLRVLLEELQQQAPEHVATWGEIKSRMDKVVWTYLNAKSVFEEAVIFARADRLSNTRWAHRWPGVQCGEFSAASDRIEDLKHSLVEHHNGELRGDRCEIHHYARQNGAEYFFAYLPDWPEDFLVFNRDGHLEALDLPTAFNILFVFSPTTGVLEMIASGGLNTLHSLRKRFYGTMTRTEVDEIPPDRPAFQLDHLLADGFTFSGHDIARVERVSVTRILVCPRVEGFEIEGLQPRFRAGTAWARVVETLDRMLAGVSLDRSQVGVEEICIRVQCVGDGERRGRRFTMRVSPRGSDLKSLDDDDLRVIGEGCLRAWEIDRD